MEANDLLESTTRVLRIGRVKKRKKTFARRSSVRLDTGKIAHQARGANLNFRSGRVEQPASAGFQLAELGLKRSNEINLTCAAAA